MPLSMVKLEKLQFGLQNKMAMSISRCKTTEKVFRRLAEVTGHGVTDNEIPRRDVSR